MSACSSVWFAEVVVVFAVAETGMVATESTDIKSVLHKSSVESSLDVTVEGAPKAALQSICSLCADAKSNYRCGS